jgi:hypothetical protein
MGKRVRRRVLLVVAGAVALAAAACGPTPPPTPNADYQFYAFTAGYPASCTETPGPILLPAFGSIEARWERGVESVDGVSEHVVTFTRGAG